MVSASAASQNHELTMDVEEIKFAPPHAIASLFYSSLPLPVHPFSFLPLLYLPLLSILVNFTG